MAAPHTETTREPLAPTGVVESFRYAFSSPTRLRKEVLAGLTVALALIPAMAAREVAVSAIATAEAIIARADALGA